MRALAKRIFGIFVKPIDLIFVGLSVPAGLVFIAYRRLTARLPWTTRVLRKIGIFPIRKHYYEPLFDPSALTKPLTDERHLPGIDLNTAGQLSFLDKLTFASEVTAMGWNGPAAMPLTSGSTMHVSSREMLSFYINFLGP